MKILHDNVAKTASSVSALTYTAGYPASNLLNDRKALIWRSTSATAQTITLEWSTAQYLDCVLLPFTNLTSAALMGVEAFTEPSDVTPVLSIAPQAVLADLIDNVEWGTNTIGANAFSYGGGNLAVLWFVQTVLVKKIVISLDDPTNPTGFLEVSNVVCGKSWSPSRGASYGCTMSWVDSTTQSRSDSGELRSDRGCAYKQLSVQIENMTSNEKTRMWQTLVNVGKSKPLFVSCVSDPERPTDAQVYQIYGKLVTDAQIAYKFANMFDSALEIEEM